MQSQTVWFLTCPSLRTLFLGSGGGCWRPAHTTKISPMTEGSALLGWLSVSPSVCRGLSAPPEVSNCLCECFLPAPCGGDPSPTLAGLLGGGLGTQRGGQLQTCPWAPGSGECVAAAGAQLHAPPTQPGQGYLEADGRGLVAVHGDGGEAVQGPEHLAAEGVPGHRGKLLGHRGLRAGADFLAVEPGGEKEQPGVGYGRGEGSSAVHILQVGWGPQSSPQATSSPAS